MKTKENLKSNRNKRNKTHHINVNKLRNGTTEANLLIDTDEKLVIWQNC